MTKAISATTKKISRTPASPWSTLMIVRYTSRIQRSGVSVMISAFGT